MYPGALRILRGKGQTSSTFLTISFLFKSRRNSRRMALGGWKGEGGMGEGGAGPPGGGERGGMVLTGDVVLALEVGADPGCRNMDKCVGG